MALNSLGLGFIFEAQDLATGVMGRVARGLTEVEGKSSDAGRSIKSSLKEFGIGLGLFGAGAATLAALSAPIASAKGFGRAIAEVSTETDSASLSFDHLHDMGLDLAAQFGKMPVEEAKGLYQAVAAGADDAAKATALMTTANKLAIGGVTTVETAIDGLTTALNAYGMAYTTENITGVSDAFFVAMRDGKTKVGDLAAQIGRVAPSAHAMGISFDEVLASVSAMTGSGLKADMAITGLHGALANIVHPSEKARAEASRLGIHFDQAALRSKGWKGFLDQITTSSKYNADSLSKLFESVEGLNAIQALTSNNSEKFNSILGDMAKKSGATENAFDKMANTLEFSEDRFAALTEVSKILIGDVLTPVAKGMLHLGSVILETFNRIPAPIRAFLVHMVATAGVAAMVVGGIIAARAAFAILEAGAAAAGISLGGVVASVLPIIAVLGVLVAVFYGFKTAYESNLSGFASFVQNAVAKVTLAFRAISQLFADGAFSGDVLADLERGGGGVEAFAIQVFVWGNRILEFFSAIGEGFGDSIADMRPAFDGFMTALEALGTALGVVKVDTGANGVAFKDWGNAGEKVGQALALLVEGVIRVATEVIKVTAVVAAVVSALGGLSTIGEVLKIGLIALAVYGAAQAGFALGGMAAQAVVAMGGMLGASGAATTLSGSMAAARATMNASIGPAQALTAAVVALYLAYDQAAKLKKEWDDNSSSQIGNKLKHDFKGLAAGLLGGKIGAQMAAETAAEFAAAEQKRMGLEQGADYDKAQTARAAVTPAPVVAPPTPPNGEIATAQQDATSGSRLAADVAAAAVAAAVTGKPPVFVGGTVMLDGQKVGELLLEQAKSDAARGGGPLGTGA